MVPKDAVAHIDAELGKAALTHDGAEHARRIVARREVPELTRKALVLACSSPAGTTSDSAIFLP